MPGMWWVSFLNKMEKIKFWHLTLLVVANPVVKFCHRLAMASG